jgi:hypothetical protein
MAEDSSTVSFGSPVGKGAGSMVFQGTVTWFDPARELVVLQDGTNVSALRIDLAQPDFQQGERVKLEGEASLLVPAFPDYPGKPATWQVLPSFEAPTNGAEYYLARVRGYLHPPATGKYTFWIASDDSSELWLSEDGSPAKARRIASVGSVRWTEARQWTRYPSQQSSEIWLESGRSYYIEALHQQSTRMECLAVAWQGPGTERKVIDGQYLSPCDPPGGRGASAAAAATTNGVLREYWQDFFSVDLSVLQKRDAFIGTTSKLHCQLKGRCV